MNRPRAMQNKKQGQMYNAQAEITVQRSSTIICDGMKIETLET